jgi:hypothetical protein
MTVLTVGGAVDVGASVVSGATERLTIIAGALDASASVVSGSVAGLTIISGGAVDAGASIVSGATVTDVFTLVIGGAVDAGASIVAGTVVDSTNNVTLVTTAIDAHAVVVDGCRVMVLRDFGATGFERVRLLSTSDEVELEGSADRVALLSTDDASELEAA